MEYSFFDVSVDLTDAGHGRVLYSSLFSIDISTKIWNNFLMLNRCYHFVVTKKKKKMLPLCLMFFGQYLILSGFGFDFVSCLVNRAYARYFRVVVQTH